MLVELQEHARIVVVIDERAAVELVEQRLIAVAVRDPGIAAVLRGVEARNGVGLDDERAVRGQPERVQLRRLRQGESVLRAVGGRSSK